MSASRTPGSGDTGKERVPDFVLISSLDRCEAGMGAEAHIKPGALWCFGGLPETSCRMSTVEKPSEQVQVLIDSSKDYAAGNFDAFSDRFATV